MLATFRETITSVQDRNYGRVIIKKPIKAVLWYWTKYQLLLTLIPLFFFLAAATYFIPQLPRLLQEQLPPAEIGIKDGRFYTLPDRPLALGNQEFAIIIDPRGSPAQLDHASSGLMFLEDRLLFKSSPDQTDTVELSDVRDFSLSTAETTAWINSHYRLLWLLVFLGSLLITAVLFTSFWFYKLTTFGFWSAVFWLVAIVAKRPHPYPHVFRLTVYAAVPTLLLSSVLFFAPNRYLSLLTIALFIFFALSWLWRLPSKSIKVHHN